MQGSALFIGASESVALQQRSDLGGQLFCANTTSRGPETLVTHPASTTHVGLLPDELAESGIGPGTIRVSTGLEHVDDLLADFAQALELARS